ncbi:helix-turn-helix domain-containing protein, partial [Acinetobacter baumannii]
MEINPNSQQPSGSSLPTSALGYIQRPGEYLRLIRVSQKKELEQVSSD